MEHDYFKNADVIHVYRGGDKYNIYNYRAITLISKFANIFEKRIFKRLHKFLASNKLISDKQHEMHSQYLTTM